MFCTIRLICSNVFALHIGKEHCCMVVLYRRMPYCQFHLAKICYISEYDAFQGFRVGFLHISKKMDHWDHDISQKKCKDSCCESVLHITWVFCCALFLQYITVLPDPFCHCALFQGTSLSSAYLINKISCSELLNKELSKDFYLHTFIPLKKNLVWAMLFWPTSNAYKFPSHFRITGYWINAICIYWFEFKFPSEFQVFASSSSLLVPPQVLNPCSSFYALQFHIGILLPWQPFA